MANDRFGCFRLHTIGMVLGWLGTIFSFIYIVGFSFVLANLDEIVQIILKSGLELDTQYETLRKTIFIVVVITLVLASIHLLASILLIVGTIKNQHLLILPWLINAFFGILYKIFILIVLLAFAVPVAQLVPILIACAFAVTLWYAIYKLFTKIRSDASMEDTNNLLTLESSPPYKKF